MQSVAAGTTNHTIEIFVPDSSKTDGAGLTGLVFNSAGLVASYNRTRGARVAIPLVTLATPVVAHADGGFIEIDATNMPGIYRLDLPDACFVAGVPQVTVHLKGAANMAPISSGIEINKPIDVTAVAGSAAAATRLKLFSEFGSYPDGLVIVDTLAGAAGTTDYENGTMLNPVLTFADAITIASSVSGIRGFSPLPGSIITLTQDFTNTLFKGIGWSIVTAGFDLSNCRIFDAFINGGVSTSDTQNAFFIDCLVWSHTAGSVVLTRCAIANDFTLGEAGNYTLVDCYQAQGISQAAINFSGIGASEVQMDDWRGIIEVKNMAAGDIINIYGKGEIIINASCTGGTIGNLAGSVAITDNAGGAVTITNEIANYTNLLSALMIKFIKNKKEVKKIGAVNYLIIYDDDNSTEIARKALKDLTAAEVDDLIAGQYAQELKSTV